MLRDGVINPLNVHDMRQLDWCPPHFEKITFLPHTSEKEISDWIYENLAGRFYMGYDNIKSTGWPHAESTGYERYVLVGFEIPNEASFFSLNLNTI